MHLAVEEQSWGRDTPKTDIVVRVIGGVVVAVRRPHKRLFIVPTAAAQHLYDLAPHQTELSLVECHLIFFCQPPNSRPISARLREACSY